MNISDYELDYGEAINMIKDEMISECKDNGNEMKLSINTKLIEDSIVDAVISKTYTNVMKSITTEIKKDIVKSIAPEIEENTTKIIREIIDDFYNNEKITVNTDPWSNKKAKEYTLKEFIRKTAREKIESGKIRLNSNDRHSKEVSFTEYITKYCVDNEIKSLLDKNILEIRNSLNKNIKELFDKGTKEALSNSMMQMLMCNETYVNIQNGIKSLAGK